MKRVFRPQRPEWAAERARRADVGALERFTATLIASTAEIARAWGYVARGGLR